MMEFIADNWIVLSIGLIALIIYTIFVYKIGHSFGWDKGITEEQRATSNSFMKFYEKHPELREVMKKIKKKDYINEVEIDKKRKLYEKALEDYRYIYYSTL